MNESKYYVVASKEEKILRKNIKGDEKRREVIEARLGTKRKLPIVGQTIIRWTPFAFRPWNLGI